jgi:LysM repeat protein
VLRAPRKVTQAYRSRCVSGARAELAAQLVRAGREPGTQVALAPSPAFTVPGAVAAGGVTIATGVPTVLPQSRTHSVRAGENLVAIARQYSCDLKELAQANKLQSPGYLVRTGLVLRLEGCGR